MKEKLQLIPNDHKPLLWTIIYQLSGQPKGNGYVPAAAAKSLQLCPTLCDPIDGSPPGSTIPGVLQARTLEWVAISFSNAWKWKVKAKLLSRVRLFVTPWTTAYQAPPPIGFSRQEYWSEVPWPSPRYVPRNIKSTKIESGRNRKYDRINYQKWNWITNQNIPNKKSRTI